MSNLNNMVDIIEVVNPDRNYTNIYRRIMKLAEEYGEFVQAYLSTTSSTNKKGLTWDDVREEICDVVIVAIDILLTKLPNELELPDEQFKKMISKIIEMKLDKWIMNSITKEKQATM